MAIRNVLGDMIGPVAFSHYPQTVYMGFSSPQNAQFVGPLTVASELVECEYCGCKYHKEDLRGKPWKCWYGCGARLP